MESTPVYHVSALPPSLPRYTSHKTVEAVEIAAIHVPIMGDTVTVVPADAGIQPFNVPHSWFAKHAPQAGWFFLRYEKDGYLSACPAEVFRRDYTPKLEPQG